MSASHSDSKTKATTTTTTIDKRIVTEGGEIFALQDNTISGGELSIVVNDQSTALAAIEAMSKQTRELGREISTTAAELASGSNAIAAQVAESQSQFVATASGQKTALYVVAGLGALLVLPQVMKILK